MKIYNLPKLAELSETDDFTLDESSIKGSRVRLRYIRLRPGQIKKSISAEGAGGSLFFMIKGAVSVEVLGKGFIVNQGDAFEVAADTSLLINNSGKTEAVCMLIEENAKEKEVTRAGAEARVEDASDEVMSTDEGKEQ